MANLDNPQTTVVGVPDDNSPSFTFQAPSLDTSRSDSERHTRAGRRRRSPASPSHSTDNHGRPFRPTPILRSARNSLDAFGYSSHASSSSHPHHLSPTHSGSICWEAIPMGRRSRDNDQQSLTVIAESVGTAEFDDKYNSHSPPRSAHSNVTGALSSPGPPAWKPVQTQSRPSAVTSFFRRTVCRVRPLRRSSLSTSGETIAGSDTTRNDVRKGEGKKLSPVLDNLEERLKVANKLHGDAVDLHMLYESGTVATMKDLRAGKTVPCCLQTKMLKFHVQAFRDHFHRTIPYSARWSWCWPISGDLTRD
jgi:hypothetical protein